MQYLYLLGGLLLGTATIIYTERLVRIFGRMDWAEHYLGPAGTYSAWKIIGVVLIIAGFVALRVA
jgi:hypothetical protein